MFKNIKHLCFDKDGVLIDVHAYWRHTTEIRANYLKNKFQLNSIQNILLVHINGIGDVVMATPTLKNMKARLPEAKIDVLTTTPAKGVLENNPYINHIFISPRQPTRRDIKQMVKNLKSIKYDLIINLMSRNSTEKLVGLLTSKWKINNNILYREKFTDVMVGFKHDKSSFLQWEFDFLKRIGFEPKKFDPEIFLTTEEKEDARCFLNSAGFNVREKLVIFHPFSSDPLREWGIERFIDLAKNLNEIYILINYYHNKISLSHGLYFPKN